MSNEKDPAKLGVSSVPPPPPHANVNYNTVGQQISQQPPPQYVPQQQQQPQFGTPQGFAHYFTGGLPGSQPMFYTQQQQQQPPPPPYCAVPPKQQSAPNQQMQFAQYPPAGYGQYIPWNYPTGGMYPGAGYYPQMTLQRPPPPNTAIVMPDAFDPGARFDGVSRPAVPPPPPGVAPNMAQLAMMYGQSNQVIVGQKKGSFF